MPTVPIHSESPDHPAAVVAVPDSLLDFNPFDSSEISVPVTPSPGDVDFFSGADIPDLALTASPANIDTVVEPSASDSLLDFETLEMDGPDKVNALEGETETLSAEPEASVAESVTVEATEEEAEGEAEGEGEGEGETQLSANVSVRGRSSSGMGGKSNKKVIYLQMLCCENVRNACRSIWVFSVEHFWHRFSLCTFSSFVLSLIHIITEEIQEQKVNKLM